jgi:hypothetical protein
MIRRYGLTPDDYFELLAAQGGTCAFAHCQRGPEDERHGRLHIDHCHTTGAVRGLLCFAHNAMLGQAADDVQALADGAAYLASPTADSVFSRPRKAQRGIARKYARSLVAPYDSRASGAPTLSNDPEGVELASLAKQRARQLVTTAPPLF